MPDRTRQPSIRTLDKIELASPEQTIMPNGIPLRIINAGEQDVVRFDLVFKGGRYQQTKPLQALLTNRMLREGSLKFTSAEIAEKLDYYGAWLELSSATEYSYLTLYSLNKYFPQTLDIIESIVKEPTFPEKELQTTLHINKQQFLVNSTKVDFISQKYFNLAIFGPEHPSGYTMTADDYDGFTSNLLHDFYTRYYNSGNCSVYLSGKITTEIIDSVKNAFGTSEWGRNTNIVLRSPSVSTPIEQRIFIEQREAMQSSVRLGALTMERTNPDYLQMRVLMTLFGGYFGSRLMSNIREDKGYTYGISAGILFYPGTGIFMVSTEADNEYVEDIIKEVHREIDILKCEPVSEKELSMVRNYMLGNMCRSYEGPFSIADAWIFIESSHLDKTYFQHSLDAILNITAGDIKHLAEKYLRKENLIGVVAGKKIHNKI